MKSNKPLFPYLFLLIPLFFALAATWQFLFTPGLLLWGEHYWSLDFWSLFTSHGSVWNDTHALGHSNVGLAEARGSVLAPNAPLRALGWTLGLSLLQFLTGPIAQRLYIFFGVFLAFPTSYAFFRSCFETPVLPGEEVRRRALIGACFYAVNSVITERFMVGDLTFLYAYALLPLAWLCLHRAEQSPLWTRRAAWMAGGALVNLAILNLRSHFLILYLVYLVIRIALHAVRRDDALPRLLRAGAGTGLLTAGYIALLAWTQARFGEPLISFPKAYYSLGALTYNGQYATWPNVLTLLPSLNAQQFHMDLYSPLMRHGAWLFPFLALAGCAFFWKDRIIPLAAACLLAGAWCAKGLNPPFSGGFQWAYLHLPFLEAFRDPTKFLPLLVLGYALSFGWALGRWSFGWSRRGRFLLYLGSLGSLIALHPIYFSGNLKGLIQPFTLPKAYSLLAAELDREPGTFRVWPASANPENLTAFTWYPKLRFPSVWHTPLNNLVLPIQKPFARGITQGLLDHRSDRLLHFLHHPDVPKRFPRAFEGFLYKLGIQEVVDETALTRGRVFETPPPRLAYAPSALLFLGDLRGMAAVMDRHPALARYPIVHVDQSPQALDWLDHPRTWLCLFDTAPLDLVAALLRSAHQPDWVEAVRHNDVNSRFGWILFEPNIGPLIREEGLHFQSGRSLLATHPVSLTLKWTAPSSGRYRVLARPLLREKGGTFQLFFDHQPFATVATHRPGRPSLAWQDLGALDASAGSHTVILTNQTEIHSVLDGLLVIPEDLYEKTRERVDQAIRSDRAWVVRNDRESPPPPAFHRSFPPLPNSGGSPLALEEGGVRLNSPGFVSFSTSYSPYWRMGQELPVVSDGYRNTFWIPKAGLYPLAHQGEGFYRWMLMGLGCYVAGLAAVWLLGRR